MTGSFGLIRKPKSAKMQYDIIRDEIYRKLVPVGKAAASSRQRVVADWAHKPLFKSKVVVTTSHIEVIVYISNESQALDEYGGTVGELWQWIDETGTRPHLIEASPGGVLMFNWGGPGSYQPKTRPSPARYGGSGTVNNGVTTGLTFVHHPGFPARHFSVAINRDILPKFRSAIDAGMRAGFKKVT